jgi:anaerobic ribonucleoside-triphosphate reductase activating protein
MKVKVAGTERNSVVDGPGLRTVIFAQGCPRRCPGCHNPGALDPAGGSWRDAEELLADIFTDPGIHGVTFSGGEPFLQAPAFAFLAERCREKGLSIVTYSGYTYEELVQMAGVDPPAAALLLASDILVDGPYREEERDISLAFRGSRNQRIIDLAATRASGRVVLSLLHYR